MRPTRHALLAATMTLALMSMPAAAEEKKEKKIPEINTLVLNEESGMAIMGFDTVDFFTKHQAIKGKLDIKYTWKDAVWLFESKENLELFKKTPEKYAPQYGGYCAYGMANDLRVSVNGRYWNIVDDKLYLHNNAGVQNTWLKSFDGFIKQADHKYEEFIHPPATAEK